MTYRKLSKIFFLNLIFFFLLFPQVSAEDITPTATPSAHVTTYGLSLIDFITGLVSGLKENKIDMFDNRGLLPAEVIITPVRQPTGNQVDKSSLEKKSTNTTVDADPINKAASDYMTVHALNKPTSYEPVTTDLISFIRNLLGNVFDIFGVANIGNREATKVSQSYFPADANNLSGQAQSERDTTEGISALSVNNTSNVLGISDDNNDAMKNSLPHIWCSGLPKELCTEDNKPKWKD